MNYQSDRYPWRNLLVLESYVLVQLFLMSHLLPLEEFYPGLALFSLQALTLCAHLAMLDALSQVSLDPLRDYVLPWFLGFIFCGMLPWFQGLMLWYLFLLLWQSLRGWKEKAPRLFWRRPALPLCLCQALLPLGVLLYLWNLRWQRLGEDFLPRVLKYTPLWEEMLAYLLASLPLLLLLCWGLQGLLVRLRSRFLAPLRELVYELHLWGLSFEGYSRVLRKLFWASVLFLDHALIMEESGAYGTPPRPFTASLHRVRLKELFLRPLWFYVPPLLGCVLQYALRGEVLGYYPLLFSLGLLLLLRRALMVLGNLDWLADRFTSDVLYRRPCQWLQPREMAIYLETPEHFLPHLGLDAQQARGYLAQLPPQPRPGPCLQEYYARVARRVQSRNSFHWDRQVELRSFHGNRRWMHMDRPLHGFLGAALTSNTQIFWLLRKNWQFLQALNGHTAPALESLEEKSPPQNLRSATEISLPVHVSERNLQWRMSSYFQASGVHFSQHAPEQKLDYQRQGQSQCDLVMYLENITLGLDQKLSKGGFLTLTNASDSAKTTVKQEINFLLKSLAPLRPGAEKEALGQRIKLLRRLNELCEQENPGEYHQTWLECVRLSPPERIPPLFLRETLDPVQLTPGALEKAGREVLWLNQKLWELYPQAQPLGEVPQLKSQLEPRRDLLQQLAPLWLKEEQEQQGRQLRQLKPRQEPGFQGRTLGTRTSQESTLFSREDKAKASYRAAVEGSKISSRGPQGSSSMDDPDLD